MADHVCEYNKPGMSRPISPNTKRTSLLTKLGYITADDLNKDDLDFVQSMKPTTTMVFNRELDDIRYSLDKISRVQREDMDFTTEIFNRLLNIETGLGFNIVKECPFPKQLNHLEELIKDQTTAHENEVDAYRAMLKRRAEDYKKLERRLSKLSKEHESCNSSLGRVSIHTIIAERKILDITKENETLRTLLDEIQEKLTDETMFIGLKALFADDTMLY